MYISTLFRGGDFSLRLGLIHGKVDAARQEAKKYV
jgi:hypothetical protein